MGSAEEVVFFFAICLNLISVVVYDPNMHQESSIVELLHLIISLFVLAQF